MGYIKLDRKIISWEWFDDDNVLKLWIYILLSANIHDKKWHGVYVPKGSFITSREKLAINCKMSEQKIRTCLKKLENTQEITIKSTKQYTHIYVNKWEEYQCCGKEATNKLTNNQPTINQQSTTTKESKESKERNILSPFSIYEDDKLIKKGKWN